MGKTNHLKPIHTEGTTSIATRRTPEENMASNPGPSMAAGLEK